MSSFILSDGGGLRILRSTASEGSLSVLLYLPGIELTGYTLSSQVQEVSEQFEVRYLSVPPADRTDFEGLIEIVQAEIAEIQTEVEFQGMQRGLYLMGESFGGVLALQLARRQPATRPLSGLILVNPATTTGRPRTKQRCQLTLLESVGFKTHSSILGDHSECARR